MKNNQEKVEEQIYDIALRSGIFVPINQRTIKYKNYMIIKGPDDRWNVFLMPKKLLIVSTFLKASALAIAKFHDSYKSHRIQQIEKEDAIFQKNYLDSIFYKNTIEKTKDPVTRDTASWRLDLVKTKIKSSKSLINNIFYSTLT